MISDAVKAAAARVRIERAERDRRWAAEDRIHKIAAARDAVVEAAKAWRIAALQSCADPVYPDTVPPSSGHKARQAVKDAGYALDDATDSLIALEEQT